MNVAKKNEIYFAKGIVQSAKRSGKPVALS